MKTQKSFVDTQQKGILFLVGTPIGNLNDISYRALETLKESDIIAAEDTRQTLKLLNHFNIKKQIVSYHEHNKDIRGKDLLAKLKEGSKVALVSDAGMPSISDPGYELTVEAINHNIPVIPIPGPNAALTGLIVSGLSSNRFTFAGFLPRVKKLLIEELTKLKKYNETIICYESPHRIQKTLQIMYEILGNRNVALVRELTKKHEEIIRGSIGEIIDYTENNPVKGEITLVIEGNKDKDDKTYLMEEWWQNISITEHVDHYIKSGKSSKEAIKATSIDRKMSKRKVYQEYHQL